MITRTAVRQISILMILAAISIVMLVPSNALATGINPNVAEGSDIVMKDMRWPFWDQGTYFCYWYVSFVPKLKVTPTFYGGLATKGAEQLPGMFHSFWGNITNIHEGKEFYRHGYGAEGAKGGVNGRPSFLKPNIWYRNVLRIFPPAEGADKKTYVGWWVKDVDNNIWYTHSLVSLDIHATGVSGNGGFVESLAPESVHRAFERRLGYCRLNGKWLKSDTIPTNSPQFFKLIENDTVLRYDRSCPDYASDSGTVNFTTVQPDEPALDQPVIKYAKAWTYGNQVAVKWSIPTSASPQLGYKLEVFDDKGNLLKTSMDVAPHVYARRLDVDRTAKSVKLTLTDIFDQETSLTIPVKHTIPAAAKNPSKLRPGLKYTYYEAPEGKSWEQLPDFAALKIIKQGIVSTTDDTIKEDRENLYAMRYRGFITARETGLYVLELGSCDGAMLKIYGKIIADNDGIHGTSVSQYPVTLNKGLHAFELLYFKGPNKYLAPKILLSWEGPGFKTKKMIAGDFVCEDDSDTPSIAMPEKAFETAMEDNLVNIKPIIDSRGHRINKVQFFCGHSLLGTAYSDDKSALTFSNLLPQGTNNYWARLWYDNKNSVDSDVMVVETRNKTEGQWNFSTMGESVFPLAVRSQDGTIAFRGDGFCFGNKKISGDFEITVRVADIDLSTDENGIHRANWLGIHVQEGLRRPFDGKRFGVYCLANGTVKGSADFPDLAGTYLDNSLQPASHRWLKIIRRGICFESYTSTDGKTWHKANEHIMKSYKKDAYVGVLFRSVPGKSRSLFSGSFDNVTLKLVAPEAEPRQRIAKKDLPQFGQVAAVVQASGDNTLYARTIGKGILQSTDGGNNWQSIDTGLKGPEALSVRSIAIHPTDNSVILRGGGCLVDGKLKSGLYRSTDSGKSWKLVSTEIDFDGQGPTVSFGEVISFSSVNPKLVAAAGETKGMFLSYDSGVTWEYYDYANERVTCLAFTPATFESKKIIPSKKQDLLITGTFADSEFETLGLPEPASSLNADGRVYWNIIDANGEIKQTMPCDLEDFGITNIAFGTHSNFATFATTRGIFYTYQRGNMFCQRRYEMPSDKLFTALGCRQFVKELRKSDFRTRATTYAAPISTNVPSPVYCAPERTTFKWSMLPADATASNLNEGITCVLPDKNQANTLYVCNRQGIHKSIDDGKSYKLVLPGITQTNSEK